MTNWFEDDDELPVVDRSTLERWATCPAQARLLAGRKEPPLPSVATTGTEIHRCLSQTVTEYLASDGNMRPGEIVEVALALLVQSRPDVQPDVMHAIRPALWSWARMVAGINPLNILHYDGGTGKRSGQLAIDIGGYRVTSEVDFCHAGPSPELVHVVDYKTGWGTWTASDVADSFQFQLHAVLLMHLYERVNGVEVSVWNTRTNQRTYRVVFDRRDYDTYRARIAEAVSVMLVNQSRAIDSVPAWPTSEKCRLCQVADRCPAVHLDAETPEAKLSRLIVLERAVEEVSEQLAAIVEETGRDVQLESGEAFGFGRKKRTTKPKAEVYVIGGGSDG